jgi:hypothetical protein
VKPTVTQAVSDRPVDQEDLVDWVNREATPVLAQLRKAANAVGSYQATGRTTGGGGYLTIWTSPELPADATWCVGGSVAAMAAAPGGGERAAYLVYCMVTSIAGVVTITGASSLYSAETNAAIDARFGVTGRTAYLEVRDAATAVMDFVAVIEITEARTS